MISHKFLVCWCTDYLRLVYTAFCQHCFREAIAILHLRSGTHTNKNERSLNEWCFIDALTSSSYTKMVNQRSLILFTNKIVKYDQFLIVSLFISETGFTFTFFQYIIINVFANWFESLHQIVIFWLFEILRIQITFIGTQ